MRPRPATIRLVWTVVLFLSLIGIAVVIRRTFALAHPSSGPARFSEAASLDANFARHARLTLLHIVPGFVFVVLGPLQFVQRLRKRHTALHRWIGRIFLVSALIVGLTALGMSVETPIGGANEAAATILFACLFLFALVQAFRHIRRRRVALHREWVIRAYAIGLAVAATRPIVGVFFATRALTHLTPHEFFGIAFWLGFTLSAIAAEVWINATRLRAAPADFSDRPRAGSTDAPLAR
jgi:uncharacterized membrane protein